MYLLVFFMCVCVCVCVCVEMKKNMHFAEI